MTSKQKKMDEDLFFEEFNNPTPIIECTILNDQLFYDVENFMLYVHSHSDSNHLGFTITSHCDYLKPIAIAATRHGESIEKWHSLKPVYNCVNQFNTLGMEPKSRFAKFL